MTKLSAVGLILVSLLLAISLDYVTSVAVTQAEWDAYKDTYNKEYPTSSGTTEAYARYYYAYNKALINRHNLYYQNGQRTFKLQENQFTDMRLISFNALFPTVTQPTTSPNAVPLPNVGVNPNPGFDAIEDLAYTPTIEDQGTVCNSGWAYATAKAVEINRAYQTGMLTPQSLSAQQLIDCAGQSAGCKNQIPETAFDYLATLRQELYFAIDYPNKTQQGMCIKPTMPSGTASLQSYARINDDDTLKRYLPEHPVVVEFNPTSFEFMHYSEGIFQQPATGRGSHFMTVVGYGVDTTTNVNYFIVQNSFGNTWGENGRIRIAYSTAKPFTKSAYMPVN